MKTYFVFVSVFVMSLLGAVTPLKIESVYATESTQEQSFEENVIEPKQTIEPANTKSDVPINLQNCDLVYNYSNWDQNIARQICVLESNGNPNAVNWKDNHGSCSGSFSLMQVGCFWYPFFGYSSVDYYDTDINMTISNKIYVRQGNSFKAWTTCRKIVGCY